MNTRMLFIIFAVFPSFFRVCIDEAVGGEGGGEGHNKIAESRGGGGTTPARTWRGEGQKEKRGEDWWVEKEGRGRTHTSEQGVSEARRGEEKKRGVWNGANAQHGMRGVDQQKKTKRTQCVGAKKGRMKRRRRRDAQMYAHGGKASAPRLRRVHT